jgi:hypothetical protein
MANGEWRMANGEWRMANGGGRITHYPMAVSMRMNADSLFASNRQVVGDD